MDIVITGATAGIGRDAALALARAGDARADGSLSAGDGVVSGGSR